MRVAIVTSVIAPYRIPVFNALAKFKEIDLTVYFLSPNRKGREWLVYWDEIEFNYRILKDYRESTNIGLMDSFRLLQDLQIKSYDAIVWGGYTFPAVWLALFLPRSLVGINILWSVSNAADKPRSWIYEGIKKQLVKRFDRWLAGGNAALQYMIELGAKRTEIYIAPNAVDNEFFTRNCKDVRENAALIKKREKYPPKLILFVGQITKRKGVIDLIKAYEQIASPKVGLVIVGDGPEIENYKDYCMKQDLRNVYFEGFQQREKLPYYYGLADIFVMPSLSEPWGLVLNEALSCSLPAIASSIAGASHDLIIQGINGYTCPPGDHDGLARLLAKCLSRDANLEAMGKASRGIIEHITPEICAIGFAESILQQENTAGRWCLLDNNERAKIVLE